jgi:hypothetical protein
VRRTGEQEREEKEGTRGKHAVGGSASATLREVYFIERDGVPEIL